MKGKGGLKSEPSIPVAVMRLMKEGKGGAVSVARHLGESCWVEEEVSTLVIFVVVVVVVVDVDVDVVQWLVRGLEVLGVSGS